MGIEIKMPALSPTMEEGTLAKWLVKEGDEVRSGDILAEIETDKATMEFEAVDEGKIGQIMIAEGTEGVKVGTVIATMAGEGGEAAPAPRAEAPKAEAAPAPVAARPAAEPKATVKDPALKAWIANTLPTRRYHLATAERAAPIEVKQASPSAPATAAAPRPARPATVQTVAAKRVAPRPELATQFMGAGPAKQGMQQTGGTMQLGATKSVAARPSESNSR